MPNTDDGKLPGITFLLLLLFLCLFVFCEHFMNFSLIYRNLLIIALFHSVQNIRHRFDNDKYCLLSKGLLQVCSYVILFDFFHSCFVVCPSLLAGNPFILNLSSISANSRSALIDDQSSGALLCEINAQKS